MGQISLPRSGIAILKSIHILISLNPTKLCLQKGENMCDGVYLFAPAPVLGVISENLATHGLKWCCDDLLALCWLPLRVRILSQICFTHLSHPVPFFFFCESTSYGFCLFCHCITFPFLIDLWLLSLYHGY